VTLVVRPAPLAALPGILRASALVQEERGQPMWTQEALAPEALRRQYPAGQGCLGLLGVQAAAVMILLPQDADFWPDDGPGEALYLHKLAVHPNWQGRGLARELLGFAALETRAAGRPWLRLDTAAERPKLRAIYENFGFRLVREGEAGGFPTAWYELEV